MATASTIKFKHPPINELVIGVYFAQDVPTLRAEHVGLFWASVRKQFPTIRQQPEVNKPSLARPDRVNVVITEELFPMGRYWLQGKDGNELIQIQKGAFLFNWRRGTVAYPHFDQVKNAFDKYYASFLKFLSKELKAEPKPQVAELTYINLVEPCEYWSGVQDTHNVIPQFRLVTSAEAANADFNYVTSERLRPDLMLTTAVRTGRTPKDQKRPVLVFEIRAIGLLVEGDDPDLDAWFARAHETTGQHFLAITSPEVQRKHWIPMND